MNIKITHNWLKQFVQTEASAQKIAECLSLTGPSVESVLPVQIAGSEDFVYDIEITTNRVDMANVVGIARETVASLTTFDIPASLKLPKYDHISPIDKHFDLVDISDSTLVPAYIACIVKDLSVQPSSSQVIDRLKAIGLNSINNLVDISNIMMIEWGIPMHFFDLNKISPKLKFRFASRDESFRLLDDRILNLKGGEIVAEVGGKIVDLCGVMGGLESGVDEKTKDILIWIPIYDKMKVRFASLAHQIRTPAAVLYEKDLDIYALRNVLDATVKQIQIDDSKCRIIASFQNNQAYYQPKTILLEKIQIKKFLGCDISEDRVIEIFDQLGFSTINKTDHFLVSVPSWRSIDVTSSVDLLEELARIFGYHRLPSYLSSTILPDFEESSENLRTIKETSSNLLADLGLFEIITYSLVSKNLLLNFDQNITNHLKVTQSVSDDFIYLRQSLIPQMISTFKQNFYKDLPLGFFEIGKTYLQVKDDLPKENTRLVAASQDLDKLKSILAALFFRLKINYTLLSSNNFDLFSTTCADIWLKDLFIGKIGKIKSKYFLSGNSLGDLYVFDVDFDLISTAKSQSQTIQITSQHSKIKRDLTLIHDSHHTFDYWKDNIMSKTGDFEIKIKYLTQYKNNLTIQLEFSSKTKDLSDDEVEIFLSSLTKASDK